MGEAGGFRGSGSRQVRWFVIDVGGVIVLRDINVEVRILELLSREG